MTFRADPSDRLFDQRAAVEADESRRLVVIFAVCLLVHLALLAVFLLEDKPPDETALREQEIPIEVVMEAPPPEQKPQPPKAKTQPPPPQPVLTPPPVKPKPPPEKVQLEDVEMARDAPKAGDSADTKKGQPDMETKAPKIAPPAKLPDAKPAEAKAAPEEAPPTAEEAKENPAPEAAPEKPEENKPDAEALDKAQPMPQPKPLEKHAPKPSKAPPGQGQRKSVADQLAALSPSPSFSLGSSAKAPPISGGSERASYESVVFGMILRRYQRPAPPLGHPILTGGMIGIYIDDMGNLTHQVIYRASGRPEVDQAWLNAVRRAAPFPSPPRGVPHTLSLTYSSDGATNR